jgi:hypothetical protein
MDVGQAAQVSFHVGEQVRLKFSGRKGRVVRVETPRREFHSALIALESETSVIVAQEDLERVGPRNLVKEAVDRRIAEYKAGRRVCP